MQNRRFSTGSIEAPDPFDQHLDQLGFYRKHTARDASCLFRVISEQMYNAQIYYHDIRDICVRYMGMYQSTYEKTVCTDQTFDKYLAKMSLTKTFGTLAELVALAYRFKRNVFLFEACNSGTWYVCEEEFKDTFLVFYTPPRHFDSVFTKSHIETVAFCQSLTYEILYSRVFKLPDVIYAVERMLHDPEEGTHISQIEVSPYDEFQETLKLSDGRYFILDHPDETECILKNYLFCHFHNKEFEKMLMQKDYSDLAQQALASSLPRRNISCVRQLLDEGIKPFSYKVAKALDSHIYRNIEFDVWNDDRKNSRFKQWSQGDSLQVGIKCLVRNIDQKGKPYYCHIQEMQRNSCVVFVETLGENRVVPFSAIKTIPNFSWMVPNYRSDKKRKHNCYLNELSLSCKSKNKCSKFDDDVFRDMHYLTSTLHIPQQYCEFITQPQYNSSRYSKSEDNSGGNNKNVPTKKSNQGGEKSMKGDNAKNAPANKRSGTTSETKSGKTTELLNVEFEQHVQYGNSSNMGNMGYMDPPNSVTFSNMERSDMDYSTMVYGRHNHNSLPLQSMIKNRDLLRSIYPANLNAQPSFYADGSDLQRIDIATLRFFYNLGHEYMRYMHYRFPPKAVSAMFQGILNDSYPLRPNRYCGGYYDISQDVGELASDFSKTLSFAGRDQQHVNKPNESQNQYRRTFNPNTVNVSKKNTKNYRFELNKGKRQYGDSDASSKHQQHQQQNYNKATTDFADAGPNVRTSDFEPLIPVMPTPQQQMYAYAEGIDTGNMVGVPVGYGMYPSVTDNFGTYSIPVPGGMMFSEQLNVEGELTQTYPYYSPTCYYSTPMPSYQMGQPQGSWYPPPIMPVQSTIPAHAPPTPSYGNYNVSDTETSAPFTQNEP